jgi:hypothetical protein
MIARVFLCVLLVVVLQLSVSFTGRIRPFTARQSYLKVSTANSQPNGSWLDDLMESIFKALPEVLVSQICFACLMPNTHLISCLNS